jgi:hypothetical protein
MRDLGKPLDLAAARQTFPAHWHHQDHVNTAPSRFWSETPLPTVPPPFAYKGLVGSTRGRCTVVGYFGEIKDRGYWVTLCKCGGYELIRGKTLRKPPGGEHMCARCSTLNNHQFIKDNPDRVRSIKPTASQSCAT